MRYYLLDLHIFNFAIWMYLFIILCLSGGIGIIEDYLSEIDNLELGVLDHEFSYRKI